MRMTTIVCALTLMAGLPVLAAAQPPTAASMYHPSEAEAKAAISTAMNDLSVDHRAKIMAIVERVNSGQLTDFNAAERQVGAVLSPDEVRAVIAETDKLMHRAQPTEASPLLAGRYLLRHLISPAKLTELKTAIEREHSPH